MKTLAIAALVALACSPGARAMDAMDANAVCRNVLHMVPTSDRLEIAVGAKIVVTCHPDKPAEHKVVVYFEDMAELEWWKTHDKVRVVVLGSPDKE